MTLPLKMRSDTELILEPGVELLAKRGEYKGLRDYLLELPYCTNVTIRGGAGSTLRMWKKDYQGPDYKHGEWRYALRIFHCRNVLVEGLTIVESGGDGIGVTGTDITIRNCVCDRNHRQGMSVFNVKNFWDNMLSVVGSDMFKGFIGTYVADCFTVCESAESTFSYLEERVG